MRVAHLENAVLGVMQAGENYTAREVAELLEGNPTSVRTTIVVLFKKKRLQRVSARVCKVTGVKATTYVKQDV
jgi:predicted transcriptional regulator